MSAPSEQPKQVPSVKVVNSTTTTNNNNNNNQHHHHHHHHKKYLCNAPKPEIWDQYMNNVTESILKSYKYDMNAAIRQLEITIQKVRTYNPLKVTVLVTSSSSSGGCCPPTAAASNASTNVAQNSDTSTNTTTTTVISKRMGPGRKSNAEHAINFYEHIIQNLKNRSISSTSSTEGQQPQPIPDRNQEQPAENVDHVNVNEHNNHHTTNVREKKELKQNVDIVASDTSFSQLEAKNKQNNAHDHNNNNTTNKNVSTAAAVLITTADNESLQATTVSTTVVVDQENPVILHAEITESDHAPVAEVVNQSATSENDMTKTETMIRASVGDGSVQQKDASSNDDSNHNMIQPKKRNLELSRLVDIPFSSPQSRKRIKKKPTLYDPQICPASSWVSDIALDWAPPPPQPPSSATSAAASISGGAPNTASSNNSLDDQGKEQDSMSTRRSGLRGSTGSRLSPSPSSSSSKKQKVDGLDPVQDTTIVNIPSSSTFLSPCSERKNALLKNTIWCSFCNDDPEIIICCFCACRVCFGKQDHTNLLLCDMCDAEYHTYCLSPPLKSVPSTSQWYCPSCIGKNAANNSSNNGGKKTPESMIVTRGIGRSSSRVTSESSVNVSRRPQSSIPQKSLRGPSLSSSSSLTSSPRKGGVEAGSKGKKVVKEEVPTHDKVSSSKRKKSEAIPEVPFAQPQPQVPRKRGRPSKVSLNDSAASTPLSSLSHKNIVGTTPKSGSGSETKTTTSGGKLTTTTSSTVSGQGLPTVPFLSRSGRPVKRTNFHDDIAEGDQHLRTARSSSQDFSSQASNIDHVNPMISSNIVDNSPTQQSRSRTSKLTNTGGGSKGWNNQYDSLDHLCLDDSTDEYVLNETESLGDFDNVNNDNTSWDDNDSQSSAQDDVLSSELLAEDVSDLFHKEDSVHNEVIGLPVTNDDLLPVNTTAATERTLQVVVTEEMKTLIADPEMHLQQYSEQVGTGDGATEPTKLNEELFSNIDISKVAGTIPSNSANSIANTIIVNDYKNNHNNNHANPSSYASLPYTTSVIPERNVKSASTTTTTATASAMISNTSAFDQAMLNQKSVCGSFSTTCQPIPPLLHTSLTKTPRRKPGARECMQISRRLGVHEIPQEYMDILLDYCERGKVEHLIRMRERLDEHSLYLEAQLAGLEAKVIQNGESDLVVPIASQMPGYVQPAASLPAPPLPVVLQPSLAMPPPPPISSTLSTGVDGIKVVVGSGDSGGSAITTTTYEQEDAEV